jgi:multiple sugar transport system substrate-binding protein
MRRVAITLFLLLLFASCGQRDSGTVVFWQFQPQDLMEELVAEFEAANPDIDVELQTLTWDSGYEKIVMAFASGSAPDLLELGSTWVAKFHSESSLEDLTAETGDLAGDLLMWETCTFGGKRFGVPWLVGTRVLFYNRTLFEEAGLDPDSPPETWGQMLEAARIIDQMGDDVYGFGLNTGERYIMYKKFMPFAWGNGGRILSEDMTRAEINSLANIDALRFYLSLRVRSLLERQDMIDEMFKQGKVGMIISGGWNLKRIPEDAPDLDFDVALVPRHDHRDLHASFAGAEVLVVPEGSKKGAAVKLARFLADPDQALRISSRAKGVQPASRRAAEDPYYEDHPMEKLLLEQLKTAKSPPATPYWVEIEDVLNLRLEQALLGKLSAERALSEMEREINAILKR